MKVENFFDRKLRKQGDIEGKILNSHDWAEYQCCGKKKRFRTRKFARKTRRRVYQALHKKSLVYKCPYCKGFHLASKNKQGGKEMRHSLSEELLKDLAKGLKQFGEYNFYDKGVGETMDIEKYEKAMKKLFLLLIYMELR